MGHYIGIDLGTTNSVICSYNGKQTHVWKSPEQNDVTPSAIYIDRRGRRYYGRRAYEIAPTDEKNAATLFKRYMGTSRKFTFEFTSDSLSPEACSAEILRVLYGYLPEEIRSDEQTGTVITVPAAFNQMKKDATLEAARLAGIGRVALIQEPVAAVMSVMKQDSNEKVFLVYDLGGGTFDVSVAENVAGRVNLLIQGGKEMCGGRDWDRLIYRKIVVPWLNEHFNLPEDPADPIVKKVKRLAMLAVEQAKIELSSTEESSIRMDEARLNVVDLNGEEIYLDVPILRSQLNEMISGFIDDTVKVTRDTLARVGLSPEKVEQIVFIGGPTCYKPLRDAVTTALGIGTGIEVNPMTAVSEGAAIYAESIDWSNTRHARKSSRDEFQALNNLKINYEKRTSNDNGRIAFLANDSHISVELSSMDTGWVSGRANINKRTIISVPLPLQGENTFRLNVFDSYGMPVPLENDRIVITRTLATVNAIPASYPIAVKALEKIGGKVVPIYLIEENDQLPKRGAITFRAGQSLIAGSNAALVFTLWEGNIREPIEDNRYIGTYRIPGTSFFSGVIPAGAEIICEYEMNESGTLHLGVSVPCVGINLSDQNFYSRVEGQAAVPDSPRIIQEADDILQRTQEMKMHINDVEIDYIRKIANDARAAAEQNDDPEAIQTAGNDLLDCRRKIALIKQRHLKEIRLLDLATAVQHFEEVKSKAQIPEIAAFKNLEEGARLSINRGSADFDNQLHEIHNLIARVLWRQDDIIAMQFLSLISKPHQFIDRAFFDKLRAEGLTCLENNHFDQLRAILVQMLRIRIHSRQDEDMFSDVNIIRS